MLKLPSRRTSGLLLIGAVFLFSALRALTQSIVYDEAHAFSWFLDGPWENLLRFNVNNHILYSYLAKISVTLFGLSEFSLRLPALLGAALYLSAALVLAETFFKTKRASLLVLGLLVLNPLLLEFFSLSRGYGLALGFYTWGLVLLLRRSWPAASINFALSIWASLTFGLVSVATVAAYLVSLWARGERKKPRDLLRLFLPGPALLLAVLSPYFMKVQLNQFGAAFDSAKLALLDLVNASFFRFQTESKNNLTILLPQTEKIPGTPWVHAPWVYLLLALSLFTIGYIAFLLRKLLRAKRKKDEAEGAFILSGGTIVLLFVIQFAAHFLVGLKFPVDRMMLFAVPLVTLTLALLPIRAHRFGAVAGILVIALYLAQLDRTGTRTWRYNAGTKRALETLEAEVRNGHFGETRKVRLGGLWLQFPSVAFYRRAWGYSWLSDFPNQMTVTPSDYDYFLFHPDEFPTLREDNVERVLFSDPSSGLMLVKLRH